jgi:hypothetical protein
MQCVASLETQKGTLRREIRQTINLRELGQLGEAGGDAGQGRAGDPQLAVPSEQTKGGKAQGLS